MPKAFVLVCAEIGSESEVLKKLKNMEGVEEAFAVYGVHDIIAKISTETMNKLNAIVRRIERTDKVKSTRTLIIITSTEYGSRTTYDFSLFMSFFAHEVVIISIDKMCILTLIRKYPFVYLRVRGTIN